MQTSLMMILERWIEDNDICALLLFFLKLFLLKYVLLIFLLFYLFVVSLVRFIYGSCILVSMLLQIRLLS